MAIVRGLMILSIREALWLNLHRVAGRPTAALASSFSPLVGGENS
jgi:hypothetical protein